MAGGERRERAVERARDAVSGPGADLLVRSGMAALEGLLTRNQLAKLIEDGGDGAVDRSTIYRRLTDRDAFLAVVDIVSSTTWSGFDQVLDSILSNYAASVAKVRDRVELEAFLKSMLAVNFQSQFLSRGAPAGWLLQAAALAASDAWMGDRPDPDQVETGREVLARRASFHAAMHERLVHLLELVLSQFGRRPRRGLSTDDIVLAMQSLNDGLVLRRFIEPSVIDAAAAADRIFDLAWAMTESGPGFDPRRPVDETDVRRFDETVALALEAWRGDAPVTYDELASASTSRSVFVKWFPTLDDVADSAARALIASLGMSFEELGPDHVGELVLGGLSSIAIAASERRALFAIVAADGWESRDGVLAEVRAKVEQALRTTPIRQPDTTATALLRLALAGPDNLDQIAMHLTFTRP